MRIDNEFTVSVPVERAWEVLTDLEAIAPCMPGAQLTGADGDAYTGKVRVKVGPVVSEYAGTVRFLEKDDAAYHAVIDAKGRDSRGAGNASAAITARLRADGDRTVVTVDTDLKISGRIAQFGSGMIKEVSTKLLNQFVTCLESKLATPDPTSTRQPTVTPEPAVTTEPAATIEPAAIPEPATASETSTVPESSAVSESSAVPESSTVSEPLDIMGVAGSSVYKRLIPLAVVVVVVVVIVLWIVVS
jgi:carbon monoxide dehydrogenase subunit G